MTLLTPEFIESLPTMPRSQLIELFLRTYKERELFEQAVNDTHEVLDKSGLCGLRSVSHEALRLRVEKALSRPQKIILGDGRVCVSSAVDLPSGMRGVCFETLAQPLPVGTKLDPKTQPASAYDCVIVIKTKDAADVLITAVRHVKSNLPPAIPEMPLSA
jgi:hypothetical protein